MATRLDGRGIRSSPGSRPVTARGRLPEAEERLRLPLTVQPEALAPDHPRPREAAARLAQH